MSFGNHPDTAIGIPEAELTALAIEAFRALGLPPADAEDASHVLVLADLFGIPTHGLSRVESYGERLRIGGINARPNIVVDAVAPALLRVDGDNGAGPVVGMHALRATMQAARQYGVAAGFARSSNHFGPVSPYAWLAAQQGFASIIGSNASVTIAPWGGSDARLGNNPIGFGVPNPQGHPFLLDMAMSVTARAKIRDALKRGEAIPDTWATDAGGRPTTDPASALAGFLLPMGGHKGYGLALVVDVLAGLLSGASYLTHVKSWLDEPREPQDLGHFYLLIDANRLGSAQWLAQRMQDFAEIVHGSPPADPAQPVRLPGEREMQNLERQRRDGVNIDAGVLAMLRATASGAASEPPSSATARRSST